jgi:hypothetical protein
MAYESTPWDSYTRSALEQAKNLMGTQAAAYPSYIPSQTKAPTQYSFYNYTPTTPMAQIQQPNYKGLLEGDYEKLQQNLASPGAAAATDAYNQGSVNLTGMMSGNGLYGSSIMANQQINNLDKVYQQVLADNAAKAVAQRYALQQTDLSDLNKFNAQNYATAVGEAKNIWAANAAESVNKQSYDASRLAFNQSQDSLLRDWENKNAYEKYAYDLAKNAYNNQSTEALMNRALALAGQGAPLSQMATNYNIAEQQAAAARQAAAAASSAANTSAWLGTAGTLAGGLLGNDTFTNWLFS